ncbi:MAG: putative metal-dependent hydrolase [Ignavibacteria bacterium]|nr:MAG: putative metal-dependent hydrolase [Ignavibacteria bacterium]KAF0162094.1 MAG: putative metal-dependent hydrolase [Ignavibacteria bacterium]
MKKVKLFSEKGIRLEKKCVDNLVAKLQDELEFEIESLEFNFVGTNTIVEINKQHLEHNNATDIITFNYSDESHTFDAEIFISVPVAMDNSKKYRVTPDNELGRLIIHGILHLIGYDDKTASKKRKMKKTENELTEKYKRYTKGLLKK